MDLAEDTVEKYGRRLRYLAKHTNLKNPETVRFTVPAIINCKNTSGSEYTSLKGSPLAPKDSVFAQNSQQTEKETFSQESLTYLSQEIFMKSL